MSQLFKCRHELLLSAGRTATKRGNSVAPRVLVPLLHSRVAKSKEELEWSFGKDSSRSNKQELLKFWSFSSINYISQSVARYDIVLAAVDGVVMVVNTANGHHLHIDQWEHPLPTSPAWYRYQNLQLSVDDIIMQTTWWWVWSKCFSPLACDYWYHCTFGLCLGLMVMMRKGPLRVISTENGLYGVIFSTICQSSKSEFKAAATSLNVPSSTIKTADQQSLQIGCKRNNIWQLALTCIRLVWCYFSKRKLLSRGNDICNCMQRRNTIYCLKVIEGNSPLWESCQKNMQICTVVDVGGSDY